MSYFVDTNYFLIDVIGLKAAQSAISANPVKRYSEHRDGVWEVCVSRLGLPVLGMICLNSL